MWRLVYPLLICTVILTWQTVRVSMGDNTSAQSNTQLVSSAGTTHTITIKQPIWNSSATMPEINPLPSAVTMIIPRLQVHAPVYDRDLDPQGRLTISPGYAITHFAESATPGTAGNYVAYGHDDIEGQIFRNLSQLQPGDTVELDQGAYRFYYQVTGKKIVSPTAVEVLSPTPDPTMTLISCTPYMVDTERVVVTAVLARIS